MRGNMLEITVSRNILLKENPQANTQAQVNSLIRENIQNHRYLLYKVKTRNYKSPAVMATTTTKDTKPNLKENKTSHVPQL